MITAIDNEWDNYVNGIEEIKQIDSNVNELSICNNSDEAWNPLAKGSIGFAMAALQLKLVYFSSIRCWFYQKYIKNILK